MSRGLLGAAFGLLIFGLGAVLGTIAEAFNSGVILALDGRVVHLSGVWLGWLPGLALTVATVAFMLFLQASSIQVAMGYALGLGTALIVSSSWVTLAGLPDPDLPLGFWEWLARSGSGSLASYAFLGIGVAFAIWKHRGRQRPERCPR